MLFFSSLLSNFVFCCCCCSLFRLNELRNLELEEKRKSMFELFNRKMVDDDFVFETVNGTRYGIEECSRCMILGKTAMRTQVEVTRRMYIQKDSVCRNTSFFITRFVSLHLVVTF